MTFDVIFWHFPFRFCWRARTEAIKNEIKMYSGKSKYWDFMDIKDSNEICGEGLKSVLMETGIYYHSKAIYQVSLENAHKMGLAKILVYAGCSVSQVSKQNIRPKIHLSIFLLFVNKILFLQAGWKQNRRSKDKRIPPCSGLTLLTDIADVAPPCSEHRPHSLLNGDKGIPRVGKGKLGLRVQASLSYTLWWMRVFLLHYACVCVWNVLSLSSHIWLFATSWTVAHQAPLSMRFSRQEYWSGLPCPPPGDLPNPGIEPASLKSPSLAGGFFITSTTWKACIYVAIYG